MTNHVDGGFSASHRDPGRARERLDGVERALCRGPIRPRSALAIALWFGLCAGVVELGLTLAQKPVFDPSPGFFRMNRHIVWSIPAVNLALFGSCGIVVALVLCARPSLGARSALAAPVSLGVLTVFLSLPWLHFVACLVLASIVAVRLTGRIARNLAVFRRIVYLSMAPLSLAAACLIGIPLGATCFEHSTTLPRRPRDWARALSLSTSCSSFSTPCVLITLA